MFFIIHLDRISEGVAQAVQKCLDARPPKTIARASPQLAAGVSEHDDR
jgi:hypothetical protein